MSNQQVSTQRKPLKALISEESTKKRIAEILGSRAPQFAAALVQVVNASKRLQNCDPASVMGAAITAACLDLSFDPNLGEAALVPFGDQCQFQLMYKGLIQLAQRSGQYKRLGWKVVYDGELVKWDELTGELEVNAARRKSDSVVGFASKFALLNGFERGAYWTVEEIHAHAKRYSQAYKRGDGPWKDDFEAMSLKTVLKDLVGHWGPKSIQMQLGLSRDQAIYRGIEKPSFEDNPDSGIKPAKFLDVESNPSDAGDLAPDAGNQATNPTPSNVSPMPPQESAEPPKTRRQKEKPAEPVVQQPAATATRLPAGPTGENGTPSPAGTQQDGPHDLLSQFISQNGISVDNFLKWMETSGRCKDATAFDSIAQIPIAIATETAADSKGLLKCLTLYGDQPASFRPS